LDSLLIALKSLADAGLGAASVLANLHHRRIVPLMERELRIHEMSEAANPTSLARSRFLHESLPREYEATRARRAISLKASRHNNDDLWSFIMLPDALAVSRPSFLSRSLATYQCGFDSHFLAEGDRGRLAVRPCPRTEPERFPVLRSDVSRSWRRTGGRRESGGGSAGSSGKRSTGCASSRDSLPRRLWRTRHWERRKKTRAMGAPP
jgi:hypothetical protein